MFPAAALPRGAANTAISLEITNMIRSSLALAVSAVLLCSNAFAADSLSANSAGSVTIGSPAESGAPAARAAASISQSTSTSIVTGSVSCNGGSPGFFHTENSYYRAFTLSSFPALDQPQFRVDSVAIGVETANDAASAGQPMTVRLHSSTTNPPTLASLTLLTSESVTVPDTATGTLFNVNFTSPPAVVVAGGILVVEVLLPEGQTAGHSFFIGSNGSGQSGPSFIRAPSCGLADIGDLAGIGFPNMHIVMTVSGNTQVPVTLQSFDVE
jgi:hypothetical protein